MKDESDVTQFILHPSSLIPHPSSIEIDRSVPAQRHLRVTDLWSTVQTGAGPPNAARPHCPVSAVGGSSTRLAVRGMAVVAAG